MYVIDPATFTVVDPFGVGINPQRVVPSFDLRTLWVTNNAEGRPTEASRRSTPPPASPGKPIAVDDPDNMYFTPDGRSAIVVAEALKRPDFRDPQTMVLQSSLAVPGCAGINHADFSIDGASRSSPGSISGAWPKIDIAHRTVMGYLALSRGGIPQDVRVSPDGRIFLWPTCGPMASS